MRHFIVLIALIFSNSNSFGQRILRQCDFNAGGYYVCLLEGPMGKNRNVPVCSNSQQSVIDTTFLYYTSDTVVLNRLKSEINLYRKPILKGIVNIYTCGYPFWFCLFKDGKLLFRLAANIECGYMATSMGQLLFQSRTLSNYKVTFKPLTVDFRCFNTAEERLRYIEQAKTNPNYISFELLGEQSNPIYFPIEVVRFK